jgi:hypothetical protein
MDPKIINFLLALITGRVWGDHRGGGPGINKHRLDIWDCEPWMNYFKKVYGYELKLRR